MSSNEKISPSRSNSKRSVSKKQSKEALSRKHSERHQVMYVQNYVIYRKTIGAGSMGKVKLAECLTDPQKQKYAVKIMPKINTESKDQKSGVIEREQRTIREMAIMRLLRHPNICQLKEYISEGDKYYMFLEYIDGGQLLDYIIKHGKLKERQARKFARQIVSALDYCHRNSIAHRDLKIENILITQSEQLKIIDFGLSNLYSPDQQLNTFCGSLYFAAPELLKAKEYTGPEVDIWSFGVVLYVLVCGKVPFDDSHLPTLHAKIKTGIIEEYPDYLGKDCIDLLSKIFVVDPEKRITLSEICTHPWMNKEYEEPIQNYLPRRPPITHVDMEIVKGMHGFGLGNPEEIKAKLEKIIDSPAYQSAALEIDQNYQHKTNKIRPPRWRHNSRRNRTLNNGNDDFQSLPAMYDPLISIYYLVKERKASDERKQKLLSAEPTTGFSRSASTSLVKKTSQADLKRRKTVEHPVLHRAPSEPYLTPKRKSSSTHRLRNSQSVAKLKTTESRPTPRKTKSVDHLHALSKTDTNLDDQYKLLKPIPKQPIKSFFQFNRHLLFQASPQWLVHQLISIARHLKINVTTTPDPFKLYCQGRHKTFDVVFSVRVYEGRWAGGKIGFRFKDLSSSHKQALKEMHQHFMSEIQKKSVVAA